MPIEAAQWLIEGRVIYAYADGKVTKDDFTIHNERILNLIKQGDAPVHIVLDSGEDFVILHPSIQLARQMLTFIGHEDLGWAVQIHRGSGNRFAMLAIVLSKFLRAQYHQATSVETALAFLREVDDTMDWGNANFSVIHQDANSA